MRWRHPVTTAFEIIIFCLAAAFLLWLGSKVNQKVNQGQGIVPPTIYYPDKYSINSLDGILFYYPNTTAVNRLVNQMKETYQLNSGRKNLEFKAVDSEQAIIDEWAKEKETSRNIRAVIFNTNLPEIYISTTRLDYTIRVNGKGICVKCLYPSKTSAGPSFGFFNGYMNQKVIHLQVLVNDAFLDLKALDTNIPLKPYKEDGLFRKGQFILNQHPYPEYHDSQVMIQKGIGMCIIFGLIVAFPIIVKRVADEESNRSREMFRMVGLSDFIYWFSHFVNAFSILFIILVIFGGLLFAKFNGFSGVLYFSSYLVIILTFFIYLVAMILFAFLLATIIPKPITAVIVAVIVWIVTWAAPAFTLSRSESRKDIRPRLWCSLLPNAGLQFAMDIISEHELHGNGAHFYNLFDKVLVSGNSLGMILLMMVISCFIYAFLIWYMDNVWFLKHGVHKPFYFLFTKQYWAPTSIPVTDQDSGPNEADSKMFERIDNTKPVVIELKNVSKTYGIVTKLKVVDKVSLKIPKNEITCLLGHNGAGKTTTMNMISGMFQPSKGIIRINGYDVVTATSQARKGMSLCPQHNPLYDELTVYEHLWLYGAIKGYPWNKLDDDVMQTIKDVRLVEQTDQRPKQLSGGMLRKLCCGIALVGGSSIVILDEPTSGLDPEMRRSIWDMLLAIRHQNRTILLTTHFMEEADALADRIAIMSAGHVICYGTTMFLKSSLGAGYKLRVAKQMPGFQRVPMDQLILRHFPVSKAKESGESEITYCLLSNDDQTDTTRLPLFFKELETRKQELGIESFGLTATSMEDVFLKVGELSGDDQPIEPSEDDARDLQNLSQQIQESKRHPAGLAWNRFKGLFIKRLMYSYRYLPMFIFQILVPSIFFILIFLLQKKLMSESEKEDTILAISLNSIYGGTKGFFNDQRPTDSNFPFFEAFNQSARQEGVEVIDLAKDPNKYLLERAKEKGLDEYIENYMVGAQANYSNDDPTKRFLIAWYNNEVSHSLPASVNLMYQAIDRESFKSEGDIRVSIHAMPAEEDVMGPYIQVEIMKLMWAILVPLTVPFLAASYILFPIHERMSKSKQLQLMTGLHPGLFHLVNFLFDLLTHLLAIAVIFIVFAIFDTDKIFMARNDERMGLFLLLFFFGMTSIIWAYVFTPLFKTRSGGYAAMVFGYLLAGFIMCITMAVLDLLSMLKIIDVKYATNWGWAFRVLSPIFNMSWGIRKIFDVSAKPSACEKLSKQLLEARCYSDDSETVASVYQCCPSKWSTWLTSKLTQIFLETADICHENCVSRQAILRWGGMGISKEILMLVVMFVIAAMILILMELRWNKVFVKIFGSHEYKDVLTGESDVDKEKSRVANMVRNRDFSSTDAMLVDRLTKKFGKSTAVRGLSFGVHQRECFGLLGVNGAGKTTTFRMITGDTYPNDGNAYLGSYDIMNSLSKFQLELGYCPQFDPLLDKLTGREMIQLFGRLRGISGENLRFLTKELIRTSDLTKYADKRTETYSGGNMRKLSLCLAIIGYPSILLLDEPTSGVDPGARRKIWAMLVMIRKQFDCSIILTSHSMAECESLCSRLGIMVSGQFRCLGSVQHLRNKYAQGYSLTIKVKREQLMADRHYLEKVQQAVEKVIPSAKAHDVHETVISYQVTDANLTWSFLFETMEKLKARLDLEDYVVSDTSLEQIFITFARSKEKEIKDTPGGQVLGRSPSYGSVESPPPGHSEPLPRIRSEEEDSPPPYNGTHGTDYHATLV